jgi:hypothetical protein
MSGLTAKDRMVDALEAERKIWKHRPLAEARRTRSGRHRRTTTTTTTNAATPK